MSLQIPNGEIVRGDYGVPHIFAKNADDAFYLAGYAVAQDRLWQMELSRRSARGKLSEILGRQSLASDQDALRFGYTDAEYATLLSRLPSRVQRFLQKYADGINGWASDAASANKLPPGFANEKPQPWTVTDSLAIGVNLARKFGKGGAGEIRNLLLYTYLHDKLKDKTADAIQDLAWQNDDASIPTASREDDPFHGVSPFPKTEANALENHLKLLPKANLLELLPGIRIEQQSEMQELSAQLGLPSKWGSYCVVISKQLSAIGVPLLMNGPQMDFSLPSVIHQMSIDCPEYTAVGMDLPGLPGILVGHTPFLAWGITSGVADTDDIFLVKLNPENPGQYNYNGSWRDFELTETPINIKGADAAVGKREMSAYGPVVIKSPSTGVAYVRRSTLWMAETDSFGGILDLPSARTIQDVHKLALGLNASFNLFAATSAGDIGWFYCGRVPIRSTKVDPRFPVPADKEHDWQAILAADKMPYVINPKQGYIANWNNKPVSWWPNFDTPIWGRIFRNELIVQQLAGKHTVSTQDLETIARNIATSKLENSYFLPSLLGALKSQPLNADEAIARNYLTNWHGTYYEGEVAPVIYDAWFDAFREQLFIPKFGNFMGPANFRLAVQPAFTWNALHGKTRMNYLEGIKPDVAIAESFKTAIGTLKQKLGPDVAAWQYKADRIQWKGLQPVLYNNRGTYIQLVELLQNPRGRFVAPPGISEDPVSPNYADQRELAANWTYFPMVWKRSELKK